MLKPNEFCEFYRGTNKEVAQEMVKIHTCGMCFNFAYMMYSYFKHLDPYILGVGVIPTSPDMERIREHIKLSDYNHFCCCVEGKYYDVRGECDPFDSEFDAVHLEEFMDNGKLTKDLPPDTKILHVLSEQEIEYKLQRYLHGVAFEFSEYSESKIWDIFKRWHKDVEATVTIEHNTNTKSIAKDIAELMKLYNNPNGYSLGKISEADLAKGKMHWDKHRTDNPMKVNFKFEVSKEFLEEYTKLPIDTETEVKDESKGTNSTT